MTDLLTQNLIQQTTLKKQSGAVGIESFNTTSPVAPEQSAQGFSDAIRTSLSIKQNTPVETLPVTSQVQPLDHSAQNLLSREELSVLNSDLVQNMMAYRGYEPEPNHVPSPSSSLSAYPVSSTEVMQEVGTEYAPSVGPQTMTSANFAVQAEQETQNLPTRYSMSADVASYDNPLEQKTALQTFFGGQTTDSTSTAIRATPAQMTSERSKPVALKAAGQPSLTFMGNVVARSATSTQDALLIAPQKMMDIKQGVGQVQEALVRQQVGNVLRVVQPDVKQPEASGVVADAVPSETVIKTASEPVRGASPEMRSVSADAVPSETVIKTASEPVRGASPEMRSVAADAVPSETVIKTASEPVRSVSPEMRSVATDAVSSETVIKTASEPVRGASPEMRSVSADTVPSETVIKTASEPVRGASPEMRSVSADTVPSETVIKTAGEPVRGVSPEMRSVSADTVPSETVIKTAGEPVRSASPEMRSVATDAVPSETVIKTAGEPVRGASPEMRSVSADAVPSETVIKTASEPVRSASPEMRSVSADAVPSETVIKTAMAQVYSHSNTDQLHEIIQPKEVAKKTEGISVLAHDPIETKDDPSEKKITVLPANKKTGAADGEKTSSILGNITDKKQTEVNQIAIDEKAPIAANGLTSSVSMDNTVKNTNEKPPKIDKVDESIQQAVIPNVSVMPFMMATGQPVAIDAEETSKTAGTNQDEMVSSVIEMQQQIEEIPGQETIQDTSSVIQHETQNDSKNIALNPPVFHATLKETALAAEQKTNLTSEQAKVDVTSYVNTETTQQQSQGQSAGNQQNQTTMFAQDSTRVTQAKSAQNASQPAFSVPEEEQDHIEQAAQPILNEKRTTIPAQETIPIQKTIVKEKELTSDVKAGDVKQKIEQAFIQSQFNQILTEGAVNISGQNSSQMTPHSAWMQMTTPFTQLAAWRNEVAQRLDFARLNGQQEVTLIVNPEQLGAIEVKIALNHDKMTVVFKAEHAEVAQALTDGLEDLRSNLAEKGIELTQADVMMGAAPKEQENIVTQQGSMAQTVAQNPQTLQTDPDSSQAKQQSQQQDEQHAGQQQRSDQEKSSQQATYASMSFVEEADLGEGAEEK